MLKKIILAAPRGPCAGVNRALEIIEITLKKYGAPVYVNHDLVHNRYVVDSLRQRGVIFAEKLDKIPPGSVYLFSAHGVSPQFRKQILQRKFNLIDATCPLVTKVHSEAKKYEAENSIIFFIGHKGHPEVNGTMGVAEMHLVETPEQAKGIDPARFPENLPVTVLTQTTLSIDETEEIVNILRQKFPTLKTAPAKDICYATTNRQKAVAELADCCDFIVVVGSKHSSNSNRLREAAEKRGTPSLLVERFADIPEQIWQTTVTLGVTSGASVPEVLVERLLDDIRQVFPIAKFTTLETMQENVRFPLPKI